MAHDLQAYLQDLVHLLKESADEARENSLVEETGTGFQAGRALAYAEVLSLMQSQADSFLIPRAYLGLAELEPAEDLATRTTRKP